MIPPKSDKGDLTSEQCEPKLNLPQNVYADFQKFILTNTHKMVFDREHADDTPPPQGGFGITQCIALQNKTL
jgi:hypothetical protein